MRVQVPLVLQAEAAECGLACLAMVAGAHGGGWSLAELRRRFPPSLNGARLSQLIGTAGELGLRCRPLRLELEELNRLRLPCILHWDLNHFVVLQRVRRGACDVLDPAHGERSMPLAMLSSHFTGVALELWPDTAFERRRTQPVRIRELTGPIAGLWNAAARVLILSFSLQALALLAPFLMQWVLDHALLAGDRDLLSILALGFGLAALLQVAIGQLRGWTVLTLSSQLAAQWLSNIVAHLLRLPLSFFESRHLGDVQSRLGSLQSIQRTLTTGFVEACVDGVMAALTLGLLLLYSLPLALLPLSVVACYLALRSLVHPVARRRYHQQLLAAARQQSHLLESLRGIQSLKVAGREHLRRSAFENLLADTVDLELRTGALNLGVAGANQLLFGLERVLVIWLGAQLVLDGALTAGMLVAFLAYKDQFAQRTAAFVDRAFELRMLRVHAERLADIVLADPDDAEATNGAGSSPTGPVAAAAEVVIDGLAYRHPGCDSWLLQNCDLRVRAGECVAIVGASGAGKTTLAKLLLGLLAPARGSVRIGGQEPRGAGAAQVRARMAAVMQDDQLFAGCIADNISFFDPDARPVDIESAARRAGIHDDIITLPMGYESLIGDMGSALSGGQKQRLLLARALYRTPQVLLLDEATSHLDVRLERAVNATIGALPITRIIIAHRPETIASADRVVCLAAGQLRELALPAAKPALATAP